MLDKCILISSTLSFNHILSYSLTHTHLHQSPYTHTTKHRIQTIELNILSESALREMLLEDLIIDSSFIRVTTVIGQGTAAATGFACRIMCSVAIEKLALFDDSTRSLGEYGVVYKGLLRKGMFEEVVAVKTLKGEQ